MSYENKSLNEMGKKYHIQLLLDFPKTPDYLFDNFVVSKGNEIAYKAAMSFCANRIKANFPLVIYGEEGSGKTHLLKSIEHKLCNRKPHFSVIYVSSYDLVRHYNGGQQISAVIKNEVCRYVDIISISKRYKETDVLLLDDLHIIEGNKIIEEQIFHIYNSIIDRGGGFVAGSRVSPRDMQLSDYLGSRLLSGDLIRIGLLTDDARKKVLIKLFKDEGINISDNAVNYILNHFSRKASDFQALFSYITDYSLMNNKRISVKLIKDIINNS